MGSTTVVPSPLHQAAVVHDKVKMRRLLFHEGHEIDDEETGRLCLHLAFIRGDMRLVLFLLEKGVDVDRSLTGKCETALHLAVRTACPDLAVIRAVLKATSDVNFRDVHGETALHYSARGGHYETSKILLIGGAMAAPTCRAGRTPLHLAIQGDHLQVVHLLLRHGADVISGLENLLATGKSQPYILRLLLINGVKVDSTVRRHLTRCLKDAMLRADYDLIRILVERGADVNDVSASGEETLLHLAATRGDVTMVRIFLQAGASVNVMAAEITALHCAAQRGHVDVVRALLTNGANINVASADRHLGLTPLHFATAAAHG